MDIRWINIRYITLLFITIMVYVCILLSILYAVNSSTHPSDIPRRISIHLTFHLSHAPLVAICYTQGLMEQELTPHCFQTSTISSTVSWYSAFSSSNWCVQMIMETSRGNPIISFVRHNWTPWFAIMGIYDIPHYIRQITHYWPSWRIVAVTDSRHDQGHLTVRFICIMYYMICLVATLF